MIISLRKRWLKIVVLSVMVCCCFFMVKGGVQAAQVFLADIKADRETCEYEEIIEIKPERYVLAEYKSPILSTDPGRLHNLKVGVHALDKQVIEPGGIISFNAITGPRALEDGWKVAKDSMVVGNRLVDSVAGGVCQVSSALYNAGLYAGLEVLERHAHTLALNYIEPGRDAAVWFEGRQDLRLRNPHNFPLTVEAEIAKQQVVVRLVTSSREGKTWKDTHKIEVKVEKQGEIPYQTVRIQDAQLPQGEKVVELAGVKGYCYVMAKRIIWENNEICKEEVLSRDSYGPIPERIRVGTGSKAGS